jgi:hypothetical protein
VEDSYDAGLSAAYFAAHEGHEAPPDARGDLRLVRALGTDLWDAGIEGEAAAYHGLRRAFGG